MKKAISCLMGVMMLLSIAGAPVLAECQGGHCPLKKQDCGHGDCAKSGCEEKGGCPIAAKVLMKAHFFISNKNEIGLSEDQVAQIKAIKMKTKANMIRAKAEMEIFELELMEKMSQPKLDTEGLNAAIDKASAGWGAGAKATLADYATLKGILSDGQMSKAKEIWAKSEK